LLGLTLYFSPGWNWFLFISWTAQVSTKPY